VKKWKGTNVINMRTWDPESFWLEFVARRWWDTTNCAARRIGIGSNLRRWIRKLELGGTCVWIVSWAWRSQTLSRGIVLAVYLWTKVS